MTEHSPAMYSSPPEPVDYDDREMIVHSLRQLEFEPGRRLELVRSEQDDVDAIALAVATIAIDVENNDVELRLDQSLDTQVDFNAAPLGLNAGGGADLLYFTHMHFKAVEQSDDRSVVFCTLPDCLRVTEYRENVRLTLTKGMWAEAAVSPFDARSASNGHLVDLSVSGCRICLPVSSGILLRTDGPLSHLWIKFPNGDSLDLDAVARHIHIDPDGRCAYVGFLFAAVTSECRQKLGRWIRTVEQEKAIRSGQKHAFMRAQNLFQAPDATSSAPDTNAAPAHARPTQALSPVIRSLALTVLALRNDHPLPLEALRDSVVLIDNAIKDDRQAFLYALRCLTAVPELFRHCISTAGWLADLIAHDDHGDDDWHNHRHDIILAALVHDLARTLWIDADHPALEDLVGTDQPDGIDAHGDRLLERLDHQAILTSSHAPALIRELTQSGDGHPPPLAAAARVVHELDQSIAGQRILPAAAYKTLLTRSDRFDPSWLKRFIARQGLYPIGSLARYSRGFLAWIMRLDEHGAPSQLRVVKNLAYKHRHMRDILGQADFSQLGQFETLVDPKPHGLKPF